MFWSIVSCQNRVSADQYHLTVSRVQVSTHRGRVLFEVIRWQVSFQMIACSSSIFFNALEISCVYEPHNINLYFKLSCFPASCYRQGRRCFWISRYGHALITFYVQSLCPDWSNVTGELMRKIYAASGNLFTDSWGWRRFVSSCDVFNCLFPLDVQNELQLLSRFFCYSWLVCLLGFWLRNAPLVKLSEIRFRMASFSKMSLLT